MRVRRPAQGATAGKSSGVFSTVSTVRPIALQVPEVASAGKCLFLRADGSSRFIAGFNQRSERNASGSFKTSVCAMTQRTARCGRQRSGTRQRGARCEAQGKMMHSRFSTGSLPAGSESLLLVRHLPDNHVTTRQWAVLHAVVCSGSYASAAALLHISQPAVSYTISKMEEQIGIPLLKIEGRKARLTEQGMKLLRRSETLLHEAVELESFIRELRNAKSPNPHPAHEQTPSGVAPGSSHDTANDTGTTIPPPPCGRCQSRVT